MTNKIRTPENDDAAEDDLELAELEPMVGQVRKMLRSKRSVVTRVTLLLGISIISWVFTEYAANMGWINGVTRDILGLFPLGCLWASARYVLSRIHTVRYVQRTIFAAMCCALVAQGIDIFEEIAAIQDFPLFAKGNMVHDLFSMTAMGAAGLLLLMSFYFALLANEEALRRLDEERKQLFESIQQRHRMEEERKVLESQLMHAQKMQAIGALAGGIAHDFNNILSSILGYGELALLKMEPDNPLRRYLEEIQRSGNRAKELVWQILVFSRQSEQEKTPLQLHLIVKEVLAFLRASIPANVEIRSNIFTDATTVLADPTQMHQMVLNLCANAQHAMRRTGGTLEVALEPVSLGTVLQTQFGNLAPGEYLRLTVSDTGHGMDNATLLRIFEPFFTTKGVGEGIGMGLATLHGIVIQMGGLVNVTSQPNQGATFQVYLPRLKEEERPITLPAAATLRGTERILVVDDEPQLVQLWTEVLEQFGYQVTAFSDSPAALATFHKAPDQFDLVLLDQTMPKMTGAQLAQEMLRLRPTLPIILATGFSEAISPEEALQLGIHDFVYKPILGNDLGQAIRKALDDTTKSSR